MSVRGRCPRHRARLELKLAFWGEGFDFWVANGTRSSKRMIGPCNKCARDRSRFVMLQRMR